MAKLYVVDVSAQLYVLAEDDTDAEDIGRRVVLRADTEVDAAASEVRPGDQIPRDWQDAYPWGDDAAGDRTVAQIMETLAEDTARRQAFESHPKLFPDVNPRLMEDPQDRT